MTSPDKTGGGPNIRGTRMIISTVLTRQLDHICDQAVFIGTPLWNSTLCGSVLAQDASNAALRNLHLAAYMITAGTATRRAQKFPVANASHKHG